MQKILIYLKQLFVRKNIYHLFSLRFVQIYIYIFLNLANLKNNKHVFGFSTVSHKLLKIE